MAFSSYLTEIKSVLSVGTATSIKLPHSGSFLTNYYNIRSSCRYGKWSANMLTFDYSEFCIKVSWHNFNAVAKNAQYNNWLVEKQTPAPSPGHRSTINKKCTSKKHSNMFEEQWWTAQWLIDNNRVHKHIHKQLI